MLRTPPPRPEVDLTIGGDVMLSRSIGDQIRAGCRPVCGRARTSQPRAVTRDQSRKYDLGYRRGGTRRTRSVSRTARCSRNARARRHSSRRSGQQPMRQILAKKRLSIASQGCATVVGAGVSEGEAQAAQFVTTATGKRIGLLAVNDVDNGVVWLAGNASVAAAANCDRVGWSRSRSGQCSRGGELRWCTGETRTRL